ncbi:MAG TPA: ATP-binding protein [Thermomicrobiales bacterium]|jgi:two-component system sensor histidine kinase KdpD|nr:ATP-binding protein [Thermomicrobiales bacterium]
MRVNRASRQGIGRAVAFGGGAIDQLRMWTRRLREAPSRWPPYAAAVALALLVALVLLPFRGQPDPANVLLLYVAVSVVAALALGSGPALVASVAGFIVVNVVFIQPYGSLAVSARFYVLALVIYLGVALVTGQLVARLAQRTEQAMAEQRRTRLLYDLNSALIGNVTLTDILDTIVGQVVGVYGATRARILLPADANGQHDPADDPQLVVRAIAPPTAGAGTIDRDGQSVATWAMANRRPAGRGGEGRTLRRPGGLSGRRFAGAVRPVPGDTLYLPIIAGDRPIGALEVCGRPGGGRFRDDDERLLATFAGQAALALDRARLTEEAARAEVLSRLDELKSALLAAVSHDLRTPLAAIKASATALLDEQVNWTAVDRRDFLHAIDEETDRLALMVGNLLDLSRIEGGALRPDREWYDVDELIGDVMRRLRSRAGADAGRLSATVEPDLPPAWFDYVEIAQVLLNLGENALKYTPAGTPIRIEVRRDGERLVFSVADDGPGIPRETQARLFDRFYRGQAAESTVSGVGIGLAICRGLVEAHGGEITVESVPGQGATFRFWLPIDATEARDTMESE